MRSFAKKVTTREGDQAEKSTKAEKERDSGCHVLSNPTSPGAPGVLCIDELLALAPRGARTNQVVGEGLNPVVVLHLGLPALPNNA